MSDLNYIQSYIESLSHSRTLLAQMIATIRQQDSNLNNLISTQMRFQNQAHARAQNQAQNQAHNSVHNSAPNSAQNSAPNSTQPLIPNVPTNIINENHIIDTLYNENLYPQSFRDHVHRIRTAQQNRTDPQSIIEPITRNTPQNTPQNTSQNASQNAQELSFTPPHSPRQNINTYSNYVYPSNYAIPRRSTASSNSRNYIFNWRDNNVRRVRHDLNLDSFFALLIFILLHNK